MSFFEEDNSYHKSLSWDATHIIVACHGNFTREGAASFDSRLFLEQR